MQALLADNTDWQAVLPTSTVATDADIACRETLLSGLSCMHALLSCYVLARPEHLPFLTTVLCTFAANAGSAEACKGPVQLNIGKRDWHAVLRAPDLSQLVAALQSCFEYFAGMRRGSAGLLEGDLLLLKILKALVAVPGHVLQGCKVEHVALFGHRLLPETERQVCFV